MNKIINQQNPVNPVKKIARGGTGLGFVTHLAQMVDILSCQPCSFWGLLSAQFLLWAC
jgi:hypothetical protein